MAHYKLFGMAAAVAVAMFAAGMFSGVWVQPETFEVYKRDHSRLEHSQSERMDNIILSHDTDIDSIQSTLANVREDMAGIKATNEAMLRELSLMRRDVNRLPR